ncbi:MAG: acyl-CoA dehydrogenase family protein, partial [Deinococcota bacterium]|nr:acyl-CoA dehydrogenase family protein [Deinococcota bacterium]
MTLHHREFSATKLARVLAAGFRARAAAADGEGKLPVKDVQALKDSGYLSLSVPRDYGGGGLSLRECVEAQLELAKGST